MRVVVWLFAGLREAAGAATVTLTLPEGATAADALAALQAGYPAVGARTRRVAFARNNDYITATTVLGDGDELALIPPVSGGAPETTRRLFEIVDGPIDPLAVQAKVMDPGCGAVVLFSGMVRDNARGRSVARLEYEAFQAMAEAKMAELGAEVTARFGLRQIAITHRVGSLGVGEISVCIAVAAPHRGEAFDACRWAIDRLKEVVPIWKKEFTPEGEYWVEPHS